MTIYQNKPAEKWEEATPLGNGRLGCMVYGNPREDILQLNEETLWSGWFDIDADNPECAEKLDEMRSLIFNGLFSVGERMVERYLVCRGKGSAHGSGMNDAFGSFQTAGEIHVLFPGHSSSDGYSRTLKMDGGLVTTEYSDGGIRHVNRVFSSFASGVLEAEYRADGCFDADIKYENAYEAPSYKSDSITLVRSIPGSLAYAVYISVRCDDGSISADENGIHIKGTKSFRLTGDVRTTYEMPGADGKPVPSHDPEKALKAAEKSVTGAVRSSFDDEYEKSSPVLAELLGRVKISLNGTDESLKSMPVADRIERVENGETDNDLVLKYFDFGRYLLASSSYNCRLPANLQGLWAGTYQTPWNGDYHININLQMNYWPAEVCNMPETVKPLLDYIRFISEHGKRTARIQYGADGWVAHTVTNPWGFTAPGEHCSWGSFMCSGAWIAMHIGYRYEFSGDSSVLEKYFDVLEGASRFFLDFMREDPESGYLVTCPSNSPENHFKVDDSGQQFSICAGPTIDGEIIRDIFTLTVKACEVTGKGAELKERLQSAIQKLPPLRVGKYGQIMEWNKDYDETEPGHRHISQLYALYPSSQITKKDPEIFKAAEATLERRLSHGGGYTGWSRAWATAFMARLGLGNGCLESLYRLIGDCTFTNMFDFHPSTWEVRNGITRFIKEGGMFQIDGNLGGCAAVPEMLMQSHEGYISLLPALPEDPEWQNGQFTGLVARGGYTVDCVWKDGLVVSVTVHGKKEGKVDVMINGKLERVELTA